MADDAVEFEGVRLLKEAAEDTFYEALNDYFTDKGIEKIEDKLEDKKLEIVQEDPTAKQDISDINKELIDLRNEKNKLTGYTIASKKKGLLIKFFEIGNFNAANA